MQKISYENPLQYNIERDIYEFEVPGNLKVLTDAGTFEVVVESVIERTNNIWDCITSFEDYNYVLEQYVKKKMYLFSSETRVLVLFYDQELGLHATMPLRVNINKIDEVPINDVSFLVNRRVQSYQEWQMNVLNYG